MSVSLLSRSRCLEKLPHPCWLSLLDLRPSPMLYGEERLESDSLFNACRFSILVCFQAHTTGDLQSALVSPSENITSYIVFPLLFASSLIATYVLSCYPQEEEVAIDVRRAMGKDHRTLNYENRAAPF